MTLNEEDKAVLYYMKGRVDSLHNLVEQHIKDEAGKELRLEKVEKQVFAMWLIGPALTLFGGIAYGIKQLVS